MRKKLRQQKGETLVESLVSLLIATLSVMMLTSAITAAARINKETKDADTRFEDALMSAETYADELSAPIVTNPKVVVTFLPGLEKEELPIEIYGATDSTIRTYKAKPEAEPPEGGGGAS